MLVKDLFNKVLIDPAKIPGVDRLRIVSGFATASMADWHMRCLRKIDRPVRIELIIGMTQREGIAKVQHLELRNLVKTLPYGMKFSCRYVVSGPDVHAKTFCWFSEDKPVAAFLGSANYTLTGFGKHQVEAVAVADSKKIEQFQDMVLSRTADCFDKHIEREVNLTDISAGGRGESITLSLLDKRTNETHTTAGINWGQRPERERKNEAYISIPANIGRSGFFPERKERFTVLTDDGDIFMMVRAQANGKALHTTDDNAELGEYLRKRMGVTSGDYVTRQHLDNYGRTDVTFTKIENETYLMDFST